MHENMDLSQKNRLITGEKLATKLAVKNIKAVQKARLLSSLNAPSTEDLQKLLSLEDWIAEQCFAKFCAVGECRHSSIAYLRYLGTFDDESTKSKVDSFVNLISKHRDGKGRWKGFPFYYTLLVLNELKTEVAKKEIEYAIPACQRAMNRLKESDGFYSLKYNTLVNILRENKHTLGNYLVQNFPLYETL
ncbi:MAG: hypothetical protein ACW98Y_01895 [Candidatus Thorarchaeota archaeon]